MSKSVSHVIIDNGHGAETPGKSSPDMSVREYAWTREVARRLARRLRSAGIAVSLLVPEECDVSLRQRVARANRQTARNGAAGRTLLVSLHVNASGALPAWRSACGWSVYVAPKASARSRRFASLLASEAAARGLKVRRQFSDKDYWQGNFAIIRDTKCPAVLSENLFMDNEADCRFLQSEEGIETVVSVHAAAIEAYCAWCGGDAD